MDISRVEQAARLANTNLATNENERGQPLAGGHFNTPNSTFIAILNDDFEEPRRIYLPLVVR